MKQADLLWDGLADDGGGGGALPGGGEREQLGVDLLVRLRPTQLGGQIMLTVGVR